jgi:hypothetical protein
MLEISGGGAKMHVDIVDVDFTAVYQSSKLCQEAEATAEALVNEGLETHEPLTLATRYAVPFGQQLKMVIWKLNIVYWCALRDSSR